MLTLADDTTGDTLRDWYEPRGETSCRLSLISTPNGELTGADGTSQTLSNPVDRAILVAQRRSAHAVITGANTVRKEPVPIPRHAPLVILSQSGNLAGHRVTESSFRADSVIVITVGTPEADPARFFPHGVARTIPLGLATGVPATDVVATLRHEGYSHLLVEGGMQVAVAFARQHQLDEVCLSLTGAPRAESHPPLPWWDSAWGEWSAYHVLSDDRKTLYLRYRRVDQRN